VFLLVLAHRGSPGQRAVKRLLLFKLEKKNIFIKKLIIKYDRADSTGCLTKRVLFVAYKCISDKDTNQSPVIFTTNTT